LIQYQDNERMASTSRIFFNTDSAYRKKYTCTCLSKKTSVPVSTILYPLGGISLEIYPPERLRGYRDDALYAYSMFPVSTTPKNSFQSFRGRNTDIGCTYENHALHF